MDEIRSSLEFYTAQAQGARIARVLVAGGGSKLDGFLELLRQRIPVQVEQGRVFEHVQSQLSLSEEAAGRGRARADRRGRPRDPGEEGPVSQVNLLPPELLAAAAPAPPHDHDRDLGGVAVLAVLLFYFVQTTRLGGVEDEIAAQEATNASVTAQIAGLQEFATLQATAQAKEDLLASAYANEISFSGLLMDVSRVIPSDAYLDSMTIRPRRSTPRPRRPSPRRTARLTTTFVGSIQTSGGRG